jgi:di/tricarboxylate transporter
VFNRYIEEARARLLGARVTWLDWLIAGAPWAIVMSAALLFVVLKMLPPETDSIAGGKEAVARSLQELGPMTAPQKRLLAVAIGLLFFWATEGKLHPFDYGYVHRAPVLAGRHRDDDCWISAAFAVRRDVVAVAWVAVR